MAQDLSQLLERGQILNVSAASSRKQVLSQMAEALSGRLSIDYRDIFDAVIERENLGSTGVGEGVAIPHARVESLDAPIGAFVRLSEGVEFDAIDGQPCDLVFMLLAPHSSGADHLRALAQVSRAFRDQGLRAALRSSETIEEIRALLCPKAVAADAA